MRDHIKILGILNIVMGCLTALAGVVVLAIMGGAAGVISSAISNSGDPNAAAAAPIVALVGVCIGVFFLILAAPAIIGGWGLITFKSWSRILMIIVSAFHLLHVPLGTALGVYGLWVLLNDDTRRLMETGGLYTPPAVPYAAPQPPPAS